MSLSQPLYSHITKMRMNGTHSCPAAINTYTIYTPTIYCTLLRISSVCFISQSFIIIIHPLRGIFDSPYLPTSLHHHFHHHPPNDIMPSNIATSQANSIQHQQMTIAHSSFLNHFANPPHTVCSF